MNLAVFLPNWIGDVVMATPALRALRQHFREAHIVGVLKPYVAGLLSGSDWLDEQVFTAQGSQALFAPTVGWGLRPKKIDLAVLFTNSFRTAFIATLGACQRRVGYAMHGRSWMLTDALPAVRNERGRLVPSPVIDAYNRLVEHVGCPSPGYRMELFTTPQDEILADVVWERERLHRFGEVITLNPGAAFGAAKHWPAEHFAKLANDLARQRGCGVLVLCGPGERELCREIVARAGHPHVRGLFDHPLSLGLTKACVKRATLLVTTDSGPRHFAAAFGRPVIALFGPTHIEWTETYYPQEFHLQKKLDCGPCQKRVCPLGHHRCMKELVPEDVFAAVVRLLNGERRSSA